MTNEQLIKKMKEDMKMRNFSKYKYDSYLGKQKILCDTMEKRN